VDRIKRWKNEKKYIDIDTAMIENTSLKSCAALNGRIVQELSMKNDELTSEIQKLRTAVNSGVYQRVPPSPRTDNTRQGQLPVSSM